MKSISISTFGKSRAKRLASVFSPPVGRACGEASGFTRVLTSMDCRMGFTDGIAGWDCLPKGGFLVCAINIFNRKTI